ncbi:uncharacterized protein LOC141532664 [Cotesia typhae]|uniref:uncharacterized protein LOC141532664 n=1 Tax=Cotesia typhae TaxID=2053667 RepID=UPI003D6940AC
MPDKALNCCGICIRSITDDNFTATSDVCTHCFHLTCVKVRCALHSRSDVVKFVADKCPICPAVQSQMQSPPQSDVLEQINEKLGLIQDISKKVNGVIEKLDDLNEICKTLRKDYESLDKRVTAVEDASAAASSEVRSNVETVKQLQDIEMRQLSLETKQLSDHLIISGIPELPTENLSGIVMNLSRRLELQGLDNQHILSVERLGKKKICVAGNDSSYSRDILVKCQSSIIINKFFEAKKVHRDITADLVIQGVRNLPVYINRRYPSALYKLRQNIVKQFPMINKKNVWISSGSVCVRLQDGSDPIKLLPSMDLKKIPIPHIDELREYLRPLDFDIIAVSESWLTSSVIDAQVLLPEFYLLRNDRNRSHGGGVLLFKRNTLSSRVIHCSSNQMDGFPEYIIAEIWSSSRNKILRSVIYRPPNAALLNDFESDFSELFMFYKNVVIIGDLNINMLTNSYLSAHLKDFCKSYDLYIVPFNATHHTATSHTWIDHCIVSNINNIVSTFQLDVPFLSGHDIISVTLNYSVPKHTPITFRCRNWNLLSNESIVERLNGFLLEFNSEYPSVDDSVSHLNSNILNIIDSIAPERMVRVSRPPAPWITNEIRDLQRRRDRLYRIFRRSGFAYTEYCNVRRLVKKRIIEAKKNHLQSCFRYARSPKTIWNDFRRLGRLKDSSKALISPDIDLDELNDHFVSVGSLGRNVANCQYVYDNVSTTPNQFYFREVTEEDVVRNMKRITTSAIGPDGLSMKYYKVLQQFLVPEIVNLFNFSLRASHFPEQWKKSIVLPIPKVRCPQSYDNYRPISLFCPLSKVLERCVHDQIVCHVRLNNLLDPLQTGFQEGMNTQTAIVRLYDDIRLGIDGRKVTIAVFFDFSKAFDCVDHILLLSSLKDLNFSSEVLAWFYSYLTNRLQAVRSGDCLSSWLCSVSGVPQGSVLGPLLFALFITSLGLQMECKHLFYADDLVIYITCIMSDVDEAVLKLNVEVNRIVEWCENNFLRLNAAKTNAIIFGSPQHVNDHACINAQKIVINNVVIDYTNNVKYLGVILDNILSWHDQVIMVCNRSMRCLARLKMNNELFNYQIRRRLVAALILPMFDYCTAAYTDMSGTLQKKLQRKLNACIRFIFRLARHDHITPSRRSLGWLTLSGRRDFLIACTVFKMLRLHYDGILMHGFSVLTSVRVRSDRQTDVLSLPYARTVTYDKSFLVTAVKVWNQLPEEIVQIIDYSEFRSKCYSFFLSRDDT